MTIQKKTKPATAAELRRHAEARLEGKQSGQESVVNARKSAADTTRNVHELQVHQIELEMQNEELRANRADLEASQARYRELFANSHDAIMTLEPPAWAFTSGNPAALAMFGARSEAEFTAHEPWELSPERQPDGRASGEKAREMIETAMLVGSNFFEWTHRRINGEEFPADVLLSRMSAAGTTFLQATVRDITDRKRAEADIRALNARLEQRVAERTAELRQSEAKLALATSGTRVGIFDRNLLTGETMATEQHIRLLGLRPTTNKTTATTLSQRYHYRDWAERVHPEDLRQVEAEMERCRTDRVPFEMEYRIVWPDHSLHWVAVRGVFECDAQDAPIRLLGIMLDISERKQAEEALRKLNEELEQRVRERTASLAESEARFRTIFDTAADGLFLRDMKTGRFVLANKACLDMLGYTLEEFTALRLDDLHLREDLPFIREEIAKFNKGETASPADVRFKRKDGNLILGEVYPTALLYDGPHHALVSIRDVTERRRMEQELEQSRQMLRGLLSRLEGAREQERTRIARDIHDDLGQNLTAIKMDLRWIERALEKLASPELDAVKAHAASAIEVANTTTVAVQELATQLRPGVLDNLGLGPAIRFECRRFHTRSGIPCRTGVPDTLPEPAPDVATALFRILQECLTNVARHSRATRTSVRLDRRGNGFLLRVHDNGAGITDEALALPQSLGLLGMKERAAMLGGEVVFQRGRTGGTVVTVRIPDGAVIGDQQPVIGDKRDYE